MYLVQSVLFDKSKFSLHLSKEWLKHHHYHHADVDDKPNTYRFRQVSPKEVKKQGYTNFKTKKLGKSGVSLVLAYNECKCGGGLHNDELHHFLFNSYSKGQDYKHWVLDHSLSDNQVQVYFNNINHQAVVVHRGSQDLQDWYENSKTALGFNEGKRLEHSRIIQKKAELKYGAKNVITIGHSKGALHAEKVGQNSGEIITLNKPVTHWDVLYGKKVPEHQTDIKTGLDPVSFLRRFQRGKDYEHIKSDSYNPFTEHSVDVLNKNKEGLNEKLVDKYWGKGLDGGRCWKGYEPVPGRKPYSKGSCRKIKTGGAINNANDLGEGLHQLYQEIENSSRQVTRDQSRRFELFTNLIRQHESYRTPENLYIYLHLINRLNEMGAEDSSFRRWMFDEILDTDATHGSPNNIFKYLSTEGIEIGDYFHINPKTGRMIIDMDVSNRVNPDLPVTEGEIDLPKTEGEIAENHEENMIKYENNIEFNKTINVIQNKIWSFYSKFIMAIQNRRQIPQEFETTMMRWYCNYISIFNEYINYQLNVSRDPEQERAYQENIKIILNIIEKVYLSKNIVLIYYRYKKRRQYSDFMPFIIANSIWNYFVNGTGYNIDNREEEERKKKEREENRGKEREESVENYQKFTNAYKRWKKEYKGQTIVFGGIEYNVDKCKVYEYLQLVDAGFFDNIDKKRKEREDDDEEGGGRKTGGGSGASVRQIVEDIESLFERLDEEMKKPRVNSNQVYTHFLNIDNYIFDLVRTNTPQSRLEAEHLRRRLHHFFRDRIDNNRRMEQFIVELLRPVGNRRINNENIVVTPREDRVREERRRQREEDERQKMSEEDKRFSGRGREMCLSCV